MLLEEGITTGMPGLIHAEAKAAEGLIPWYPERKIFLLGQHITRAALAVSNRMRSFIFSPMMAEIAQAVLGPDVYLFNEQWVVKNAEQGMKFSWHQDSGYVKWSHPEVAHPPYLTCWCTPDDVSEANCTAYILPHSRGGTANRIIDHTQEPGTHDLVGYLGDDPGDPVIVPAGSIVAFTSYTLHRSGPNLTNRMRRIYLPQYSSAPIGGDDIKAWAMVVPFVKDVKVIYDAANDLPEKYGHAAR
ncbi:MAG: hypothetical protein RLZZ129_720 [Verrucomicrobiota bacterium]